MHGRLFLFLALHCVHRALILICRQPVSLTLFSFLVTSWSVRLVFRSVLAQMYLITIEIADGIL